MSSLLLLRQQLTSCRRVLQRLHSVHSKCKKADDGNLVAVSSSVTETEAVQSVLLNLPKHCIMAVEV